MLSRLRKYKKTKTALEKPKQFFDYKNKSLSNIKNATPGIPKTPDIRQFIKFIEIEKSKKPLIRFASSKSRKPDTALRKILNISLMGAAAILKTTTALIIVAISRKIMAIVSIKVSFHKILYKAKLARVDLKSWDIISSDKFSAGRERKSPEELYHVYGYI